MELKEVKNTNNCEIRVAVACEEKEWAEAQENAFQNIAKNVTIKGFRKGKAPLAQARRAVSTSDILNKAADKIVDSAYRQMLENKEIRPMLQPKIEVKEFSEKSLSFEFIVVAAPVVEVKDYKGIEIEKKSVTVSKADIDKELNDMVAKNAELEVVEEGTPAEKGMTAVIDFVGFVDGKAFDGGEASNFDLELGSNTFVPGFEDQLIGAKTGETKEVVITFPENYVANLSGKEAIFKVTINELKKKVFPALDDDFAKEAAIDGVSTLTELKEYVKKQVSEKKTQEEEKRQINALVNAIVEKSTFNIHDDLVSMDADNIVKDFTDRITSQGFDIEDYYKMTQTTAEKIKEQAMIEARNNAKRAYVLNEIGKLENIVATEEVVNNKLAELAELYKANVEDLKKQLGERLSDFAGNIRNDMIVDFLRANNSFVEKAKATEDVEKAPAKKTTTKKAATSTTEKKATVKKTTKKASVSEDK